MGVVSFESEDTYAVPPGRMFKALTSDILFSKIFPDVVKNVELLEGDGGPGSITKFTIVEGGQEKSVKHKIEEVDKLNLKSKYSVIEGNDLADLKLEKISYEHQWGPSANGGSICKTVCKLHAKGEVEITEERAKAGKEKALGLGKAVEAYLQANPDVCN